MVIPVGNLFVCITPLLILLFANLCPSHGLHRCHERDSEALLLFRASLNDSNQSGIFSPWVKGTDCCLWHGVECDNHSNRVVQLDFDQWDDLRRYGHVKLAGGISDSLCNLSFLTFLDLSFNELTGTIPPCLGNLLQLQYLILSYNQLSGEIPNSIGNIFSLVVLDVSNNKLSGHIPYSLANLTALNVLDIAGNAFNDSIGFSLPSSLSYVALSLNQTITDAFLHNLTMLKILSLSHCVLNISTTWIPPFQLEKLDLISCNINDGLIPPWISSQWSLEYLSIVNSSLVGEIPPWLWDSHSFIFVNLSGNHLQGSISGVNTSIWLEALDLSNNALSGCLPSAWPSTIRALKLKDNLFSGKIPSNLGSYNLLALNLESNNLTGSIPSSLVNCLSSSCLEYLNLGNNNLEGEIPKDIFKNGGGLSYLVLRNNKLSGLLPNSMEICTGLEVLDIGNNFIEGQIPKSIGKLSGLRVLVMKGNHFTGIIPDEIGDLDNLHILDLSFNQLSGFIPRSIVSLDAMVVPKEVGYMFFQNFSFSYIEGFDLIAKGLHQHYPYVLSTFTFIDLSHNQLSGDIPSNFTKLQGLRFLNLSMNNLSGIIPPSLGEMGQLESLDLSMNRFFGKIPEELKSLSALGALNLSNNNLSGWIPQEGQMATFKESSFLNNPNLWGCPLPKNCSWPEFAPPSSPIQKEKKEKESEEIPWFEIAVGLSYVTSFTIVMILLLPKIM